MAHKRSVDSRGKTVGRVARMLREDEALSLARRRPVSSSLHVAVARESLRLDEAGPRGPRAAARRA